MNKSFTVFKKEIIDSIRDRRTLVTAVLMPIFLMPIILIGSLKFQEYQQKQIQEKKAIVAFNSSEAAAPLIDYFSSTSKFTVKESLDYKNDISNGVIQIYLSVKPSFKEDVKNSIPSEVEIVQKSSDTGSSSALQKVTIALQSFNQQQSVDRLVEKNIDPQLLQTIVPKITDIATAQERGGFFLGLLLPMFLVIFAIVGGMYIAIDVSAGEKERKTLEALLLTPASRFQLVVGKFIAVAATSSVTIILSLFSLYAAFKLFPPRLDPSISYVVNITPGAIGIMLGIGIILAVMFSALLLSVAIFAKSYKEAQNYISPFYLATVLPIAIFAQLPGFKPTAAYFFIPAVNAVFVIKEVLLGVFDIQHIIITIISLIIYSIIAIVLASSIYSKEGILFRD